MNRKLSIGVLGVGDMGRCHAENIRRVVQVARVVAVADVNLERAKKVADELEIEHYFHTLEDMRDEVSEVQAYSTVAIRPEVAKYGDVVASVVNLKYEHGAIGIVESYVQALYAYDVRTEVVGSKGSIFIGSVKEAPVSFFATTGAVHILEDHYRSRFAEAYVLEMQDFADNVLHERLPRVTGDDGLKALAIAVAADHSHLRGNPCEVSIEAAEMAGKG